MRSPRARRSPSAASATRSAARSSSRPSSPTSHPQMLRGARGNVRPGGAAVPLRDRSAKPSRMANDTEFGLAAYFYTRDLARSWRVAEALEYGIVGLNTGIISTEVAPFGGVKESGMRPRRLQVRHPRLHRTQIRLRRRRELSASCSADSSSIRCRRRTSRPRLISTARWDSLRRRSAMPGRIRMRWSRTGGSASACTSVECRPGRSPSSDLSCCSTWARSRRPASSSNTGIWATMCSTRSAGSTRRASWYDCWRRARSRPQKRPRQRVLAARLLPGDRAAGRGP